MATTAPITAPSGSPVRKRVEQLRDLSARDPVAARDRAWAWFGELHRDSGRDRAGTAARLDELFRLGVPPAGLDGEAEGMFVTLLISPPVDRAFRAAASVSMPWLGKRFDSAGARGCNLLRMPDGGQRAAVGFATAIEPGKLDPDVQVLRLDYGAVERNPPFLVRPIRDELVEIVPGASLGKILRRSRGGSHRLLGYFALRS